VDAATNMKITAQDLLRLGIIDGIIPEPIGGAHRDGIEVVRATGDVIVQALASYDDLSPSEIRQERREKFLSMGRAS
jgi:acetyl-CoA carboxylase carboxyl transferase subunit alpha